MAAKNPVHKNGRPTKAPAATKKGVQANPFGFGNKFASPNKKLEGPVTSKPKKGPKIDKKGGKPNKPLKGPVGATYPLPNTKSPRRAKAK